jgi:type IV pilus assembly protein PilY1
MKHLSLSSLIGLLAAAGLATAAAVSEISPTPLNVTQSVKPRVLFVLSNDHALYYKAYTDWNDLTGDGKPDTTYVHTFKYYGYFDPTKCYDYVIAAGRFEPKAVTTDPNFYCDAVDGTWSGNFLNWATMSRMDIVRKVLYGGHRSTDTAAVTVLERAYIPSDAHSFAKYYEGTDSAKLTPFDTPKLTLCNTTYADSGESQNITTPPQIRVARGDFRYWAANERWQCTWDDERGDSSSGDNTTDSNTSDPNKNNDGLGEKNYSARVQVCVAGKIGAEECKRYPDGNYKPVGLLHTYGEDDQLLFGLLTGSYAKNKSGGMLRKNISAFSNEVNTKTDGTFTGAPGIVATLDRLRIARYQYGSGKGYYNETDSCPWALSLFDEGKCSNWGNPLSEMYLEALRYMAGLKATANFSATDDTYIEGLTSPDWTDPLDAKNWCAHCDVIVLNASEPSYDNDGMDSGGLSGSPSAADKTNAVGKHEGINNNDFFVGENGTDKNQLCTGKKVPALGDVRGACPGAPRLSGTYYAAGLAHWAHTNDIRFDLIGEQTVTTRAVTLSPAAPKLVIPVPGGGKRTVSILPACRNLTPNPDGNCAIVDFKIIDQDVAAGTGEVYVNWEDSEQGGDYDQDMKGTLSYAINSNTTVTVTTKVDRKSTPHQLGFGYVIGGTTQDGFHVHTGINNFKYTDPSGVTGCTACDPCSNGKTESPVCPSPTGACSECNVTIPATSVTYTLGDSTAGLLEEPMWYAAKYGSFIDSITKDKFPDQDPDQDQQAEWDADGDKRPDGFFFASNPTELGPSLARFLDIISTTSSAAAVAANSARLNSDTRIYQARYDTENWTGDLIAFPINSDGTLDKAAWHAQDQIGIQAKAGTRRILTTNEDTGDGVPFRWSESNTTGIATAQISALNGACATCIPDGPIRLNYLRGSQANEISQPNGTLRTRDALLGDIVNSEPVYVGPPADYFPKDLEKHSYRDFANTHVGRAPVLYVGANDGMLHAFMADTGAELFAYVPRALYPKLAALTMLAYQTNHQFYVDLGPTVTDAYLGASKQWRSVLVAGLGAGGAGIFAIDVTDPAAFEGDEEKAGLQVLWDIVGGDTGFEQLGYTFSKPAVVRLPGNNHNGVWAAVFGNGYESINGQAVLYLVNAATGERLEEVIADTGPGNGLSSVAPIDYDGDAKVDYIYAGDLQGRLWRFEPTTAGGWKVSFDGKPLFTNEATIESIRTYQPITVRPEVVRHRRGGVLVLFGTGSYYRTADRKPNTDQTKVNAFYGIWDRLDGTNDIRTTHLLQQQILAEQTVGNYEVRVTSDNAILWHKTSGKPQGTPPTTHLGWSLKLVDPIAGALGEIQVTNPLARDGRIIFTTMIPSDVACDFGGKGWLMELDLFNGKPVDDVLFDLNGDGVFDTADMVTIQRGDHSVLMSPTGIGPPPDVPTMMARPTVIGAGFREFKYVSETKDAGVGKITEKPANPKGGRRSWLQVH